MGNKVPFLPFNCTVEDQLISDEASKSKGEECCHCRLFFTLVNSE